MNEVIADDRKKLEMMKIVCILKQLRPFLSLNFNEKFKMLLEFSMLNEDVGGFQRHCFIFEVKGCQVYSA
jgi:hypothetical protein